MLLSAEARRGSIAACRLLLAELKRDEPVERPSIVDELARRRREGKA